MNEIKSEKMLEMRKNDGRRSREREKNDNQVKKKERYPEEAARRPCDFPTHLTCALYLCAGRQPKQNIFPFSQECFNKMTKRTGGSFCYCYDDDHLRDHGWGAGLGTASHAPIGQLFLFLLGGKLFKFHLPRSEGDFPVNHRFTHQGDFNFFF